MRTRVWITPLALALLQVGCDGLLSENPRDTLTTENFYRSEADATAAIAANYRPLSDPNLFGTHLKSALIKASDYSTVGPEEENATIVALTRLSWDPTTPRVTLPWAGFYTIITRANLNLEKLPEVEMNQGLRAQIVGEAKFLRALSYFYLVRLYGDVPLVTTTDQQAGQPARTPREQVFAQILTDAQEAAAALPLGWSATNKGRATRGAAQALLADVHLWRKEWQLAANHSRQIIDSGAYGLEPNYLNAFLPGSESRREEMFAAQASGMTGAPTIRIASMVYPRELIASQAGGFASMIPLAWHLDSYPTGDYRRAVTYFSTGTRLDGRVVTFAPHVHKFRPTTRPGPEDVNWPIYRYGEVLLMYAEASNELNQPAEAVRYLNMIRARARLGSGNEARSQPADYTGPLTQAVVREAIFDERRLELAFEAKRWFDMVRRGEAYFRAALSMDPSATDAQPTDMLWPIPQFEIDVNSNLTQNPGY